MPTHPPPVEPLSATDVATMLRRLQLSDPIRAVGRMPLTTSTGERLPLAASFDRWARDFALLDRAAAGQHLFLQVLRQHGSRDLFDSIRAANSGRVTVSSVPIPAVPSRFDFGALLTAEGKRVGVEVGVQEGRYLEVGLSSLCLCVA